MRNVIYILLLLLPRISLCDSIVQRDTATPVYDDIHWCVAGTPEEDLRSVPLTTSTSRVTFWEDVREGGKIALVVTVGCTLTGVCVIFLNQEFMRRGGIDAVEVFSYLFLGGLIFSVGWSLAARWGDKTEKLGWRTFVKPVAILGVSTIIPSLLWHKKEGGVFLSLVTFLFGGTFILGRIYGKREPATQAVRIRPDGVSFNLMTLFDDADDV